MTERYQVIYDITGETIAELDKPSKVADIIWNLSIMDQMVFDKEIPIVVRKWVISPLKK